MSCNPSSPKRQKLCNNIVVPTVNNVAREKQKFKLSQETSRADNSITCKKVDSNETNESSSTIPTSLQGTWAANYLQRIGLDKKSSIWNCKIPRKTTSERCVVTVEQSKKTTEVTPTSTCTNKINIENSNHFNIPNKIVTDLNTLKDSNTKIKRNVETQNRIIKDKSKSKKPASVKHTSGTKNFKTHLNILMHKNENISNDQNKIKTYNIEKKKSLEEPIILSGNHNLHIKTENLINTTSEKDRNSKFTTEPSSKSYRQRCQNIIEKSNIKSVMVKKNNVKDSRKSGNQTTNDSSDSPAGYAYRNDKEKCKNSKCSTENVTSINNIKVTENHAKHDDLNKSVLKNARHNSELKTKVVRSKAEVSNKTKATEQSSKSKSDLKSVKKTIKSPIKRKSSKPKKERIIKIVINLICQKSNSIQTLETPSNESNDGSTTCTGPNVDLDFLNDFDIDEIVKSLDICEKKQSDVNLNDNNKNNDDAIDLIKTIKGEEDDDLIKNGKDLLISNVVNNDIIFKNSSQILVKTEVNEAIDMLHEVCEQSSNAASNLGNGMINKDIKPVHIVESYNVNKNKIAKGQEISFKKELDVTSDNSSQSPSDSVSRGTFIGTNKINTEIKEEKNIVPFVSDAGSSSVFNKVNTDSNKEFKLDKDGTENINEAKCSYISISENNLTNDNSQVLNENFENFYNIYQNEKPRTDIPPKNRSAVNNNKIVDEKNTIHACSSNALKTVTNSIDLTNKSEQNDAAYNLHQLKSEKLGNKCLIDAGEQENGNNNENNIKAIKDVKNSQEENMNITNTAIYKSFSQQINVNVKTKHGQNTVSLVSNKVKGETISFYNKCQENRDNSDKVQSNVEEYLMKNKEKNLADTKNETLQSQKQLSDCIEHTLCNIKSKDNQHSILEQRLLTCTGLKYTIISLIRDGRYSKIFKCKHPSGKHYALKMTRTNFKFNWGKQKAYMLESLTKDIPRENLFIVCLMKDFNVGRNWCFLMEYYPKNLDQVLSLTAMPFTINQIQEYARQLVMAVMVLRNKNMVHRDIKPKHILVNSSNNMLKLCGFDSLCSINHMEVLPNIGTVSYRAPEVILGYKPDYGVDVWSTGLVLYEMATNTRLFPGRFNNDILYKQMCTLGVVPYNMIKRSRFAYDHFVGTKFMRKSGFKGQNVNFISKFNKNNGLCDNIYKVYFQYWSGKVSTSQLTDVIEKFDMFIKLLQKMLVIHPESRLPIEFVYSNPFIYDAYSSQK